MAGDENVQSAHELIQDLQFQVASLKKRIQVLELENARLSTTLSEIQKMYGEDACTQVLQDAGIMAASVRQSMETMLMEKKMESDIHGPSQCNPSFPSTSYVEDKDRVIIQGSSFRGTAEPDSPSKHKISAGNEAVNVISDQHESQGRHHGSALDQVNMEIGPLRDADTVHGQKEAGHFLVEHGRGFHVVPDIQVDQKRKKQREKKKTDGRLQSVSHYARRYVALKIMYFGQRFYGFASEARMEPTVESEIFAALEKTRLLIGALKEAHYTRCGRTDKGVSAIGQVIALYLRSNLTDLGKDEKDTDEKEIDYVRVLNRALPSDIRVIGWSPAPRDFHARFSCLSREYKYFFLCNNLDISAMEVACEKFVGDHDFRNFCKMDAQNVHNYRRRITAFEIVPCGERWVGKEILAMQIKGSAFLWHQVRCMAAVLFMVGHGMELPTVIDDLLDTHKTVRKPQYTMASELPLVLQSCEFEGLNFRCPPDVARGLHSHVEKQLHTYLLGAAIFHEALCQLPECSSTSTFQPGKKKPVHAPLTSRSTEPTYEERKMKLSTKLDPVSNDQQA